MQQICNDIMKYAVISSEKSSKNGLNIVKNLLQEIILADPIDFSQIQLINQNFGKYFAKNVKILQKFFPKVSKFRKIFSKNVKMFKKF